MKVGGWSAGSGAAQRQGAPNDAQDNDACGGADWRWLDDPDCKRSRDRARNRENASARQQPFESSSGFRVTRTLGPDG
jgi:hypothetical protein